MTYCLDTNVLIDIVNQRRPQVRVRYDAAVASGAEIVTSALAAFEFLYGASISRRPVPQTQWAQELLADMRVIDWTYADGLATTPIRRYLRKRGTSVGAYDLLIAGQAVNNGWVLVSANLSDFDRVEGLSVVDWTAPLSAEQE